MENGILHVDMNNFYASVETLFEPRYSQVPMAVAGEKASRHGIILAKNMLAKKAGVKTAEPIWQAKRKCPQLEICPPHRDRYLEYSRKAKEIYYTFTDQVESFGLDECWLDVYGSRKLFGSAEEIAEQIRRKVKETLGLTVSIGVSYNKVFAKLGSDYKKPDAVTVFGEKEKEPIIWKLPVESLLFVGPKTEQLLKQYGIFTIGEAANTPCTVLERLLGKSGVLLWKYANGLDDSPVVVAGEEEKVKTVGNSMTLPRDISREEDIKKAFLSLAESVSARLRKMDLQALEVQITVRNSDFQEFQRQCRLDTAASDSMTLYRTAMELFRKEKRGWNIRLLGLRAGKLEGKDTGQLSFFGEVQDRKREERLETAMDLVRSRFGRGSLERAMAVKDRKDGEDEPAGEAGHPDRRSKI